MSRDILHSLQCYFNQCHNVVLTDLYCTTHAKIYSLCHFRANACGVPSNPEGAPAGGISALVYGVLQPLTSNIHPTRNAPCVVPFRSSTNFLPFLSGSGEKRQLHKSRWTGFGSEQPEIAARQTATPKSVPRKNRDINPIELKFLRSRGFFQEAPCGFGQSPRS